MLLGNQNSSDRTYIIIPVVDTTNLDQKNLIDKTPFYCQPINTGLDFVGTEVWADACQTYNLYVKRDFYLKCASKSYNIFSLIDSYFIDTIVISANKDISFNYSKTTKIPVTKYKLVCQALINWFSAANWWWQVFPDNRVGIISLTESERAALSEYPRTVKGGQIPVTLQGLCSRIIALIQHICSSSQPNTCSDTGLNIWLRVCNSQVSVRAGAKLAAKPDAKSLAVGILDYLVYQTGFIQLCKQEYQGPADFLLFNLPQPISELCLSCFIRGNKLLGLSQTDLSKGYTARLTNLVSSRAQQIIEWINVKWQQLIAPNSQNSSNTRLEYEDVVLTIELVSPSLPSSETKYISGKHEEIADIVLEDIRLWNIQMGYGSWTTTGSKLFTWAELELLTGKPPVIKLMANNKNPNSTVYPR